MSSSGAAAIATQRQYGPAKLVQLRNSPVWYIQCEILDDRGRTTSRKFRKSTRTEDVGQAQDALAKWIIGNRALKRDQAPTDIRIAAIIDHYVTSYLGPLHAKKLGDVEKGERIARNQTRHVSNFFGALSVAQLDDDCDYVQQFIDHEHGRGIKYASIEKRLRVLSAALNRAYKNKPRLLLQRPPHIACIDQRLITSEEAVPEILTRAQLKDILLMFSHRAGLYRAIIIMLATGCRPEAACDLAPRQCDFERDLIALNPPGRIQEVKKHRPIVRMVPSLKPLLRQWATESNLGPAAPYALGIVPNDITVAFADHVRAQDGLGLTGHVVPYSIRHTVEAEMEGADLPEIEIKVQLGHVKGYITNNTTRRYGRAATREYRPSYLKAACEIIDRLLMDVLQPQDGNVVKMERKASA